MIKRDENIIATKIIIFTMRTISKSKHEIIIKIITCLLLTAPLTSCTSLQPNITESTSNTYQSHLIRGGDYLNTRKHSQALKEFTKARFLQHDQSEPLYGQIKALFYMDRFAEVLDKCTKLAVKTENDFDALGFCWGARIEISKGDAATREKVQSEIETFLKKTEPSDELLYGAYQGYYFLKNRAKRLNLILQLAEKGANSSITERVTSSLLQEIISSKHDDEQRIILAESYIRNFPLANMADKVALIVLQEEELKIKSKDQDLWPIAQRVLKGRPKSPLINGAVALWLIENKTGYDHAIGLLQENLAGLGQAPLPSSSRSLQQKEVDKKRLLYNYLLGRAWLGKGELAKAKQLLDNTLQREKTWAGVYHFLGIIALRQGRIDRAIQLLGTALAKGSVRKETSNELRALLKKYYGFEDEPLAYFQKQQQGTRFKDVTERVGLGGIKAKRVAWGDYDNDGDDDLLLDGTRLYSNQNGGRFQSKHILPAGIPGANGGIWGDYDNDQFLDIFVTSHGENYLLHNENGLRFSKSEAWSWADNLAGSTEAAAWGDVNNDGYLDIYVANYEHGIVMRGQCEQDQLFVNNGGTSFEETRDEIASEEAMCGRGVTWSDFNRDGRLDIHVSNYRLDPNFLWLNQGNSSLIDVAESAGVQGVEIAGSYGHSIGSVSGDLDGDGDFDLFTSNLAHPRYIEFSDQSQVLLNNGTKLPEFVDNLQESGITFDETSADPLLLDADNDGDLDMYISSVYPNRSSHLYINNGKGEFTDQTWIADAGVMNGWGTASSDYDGDGYLDLLVASPEGVRLLHNEGGGNNWLAIKINDHNCNHYGVGSKVVINYGKQSQIREITAGRGTGSQDSLTVLFGLGNYDESVYIRVETLCGDILQHQTEELNRTVIIENILEKKPEVASSNTQN